MAISAHAQVPPSQRLNDADTTNLTAIQRPADARWPINQARPAEVQLLDGEEDRALWDSVPAAAADLALIQAAIRSNPESVHQLATVIDRGCPPWCAIERHTENEAKIDGFLLGEQHERILVELTAGDPSWTNRAATATVMVESSTEGGQVVTAPRVVLTVAEGDKGSYPGTEDTQGWTGSPAQARALAAKLLAAADLIDPAAR